MPEPKTDPFAAYVVSDADPFAGYVAQAKTDGTPSWLRAMEQGGRTISDTPNAVAGDEPSTFTRGFLRSIKDQVLNATAGNPMLQGAARPKTSGDMLGLVVPDANVAGKAIGAAIEKGPQLLQAAGRGLQSAGRATRSLGIPSGVATMVTGHAKAGAAVAAVPYAMEGAGHAVEATGRILGRPIGGEAASVVDRYMPNVSTAERSIGPTQNTARVPYTPQTEAIAQPVEGLDRYMPNTSDTVGAASAPSSLARVPYATQQAPVPAGKVGRLTSNRTPTLTETLTDAVQAARAPEPPMAVSHRPQVELTPSGRPGVTGQEYDLIQQGAGALPSQSRQVAAPRPSAPAPQAAPQATSGLSDVDRAALVKRGYTPEVIAKIEQQMGVAATPVASHTPSVETPSVQQSRVPDRPDLQLPRQDIGAERVGRAQGMTREDVRQAVGARLDEARGEASPILPDRALKDIVDKLKSLPPGGPEREAYVAAATSGKTKWQVENIRRTLEHLGLVLPVIAAPTMRDALMRRMQANSGSGQPGR